MPCYYSEVFVSGMIVAFFIFAMIILFEDAIKKGLDRVLKRIV